MIFVVDMSVVLMNLMLGLAVNDVDSILQDSKVRRMVHETLTVTYLEQVPNTTKLHETNAGANHPNEWSSFKICLKLCSLPFIADAYANNMRITNSSTCQFKEMVYLELVDIVQNDGNEIVVDKTPNKGGKSTYPCPATIAQGVAAIQRSVTVSICF